MPNHFEISLSKLVAASRSDDWVGRGRRRITDRLSRMKWQQFNKKEKTPMQVQEIMSKPAVTCRPSDTLNTAAQRMWEHDCGAIPVVHDNGSITGVITDRDICMAAYTQGRALSEIPVSSAMAKQVFSCRAGDSIESVDRLMADKQIRRVPVLDASERPIGIVSVNDLARHAALQKKNGLDKELVLTLAAICEPRSKTQAKSQSIKLQQQPAHQHRAGA